MGVARGLERRLERLVDGLAARLFRGRMHPVELGSMLVREADLALVDGPAGPSAPNRYRITMGGDPVDPEVLETVTDEQEAFVEDAAADRGWRLEGPAAVTLLVSPEMRAGEVTIDTAFGAGSLEPWAVLHPLDPHGEPRNLAPIRCLVGRSKDTDVQVVSDTVSRTHALIWQEAGAAWVADLDSSNGTYLNGTRISDPAAIVSGDVVTFGDVGFTIREP